MKITARVQNREGRHEVFLKTNENAHSLSIPPRPTGFGSSANGGELLFLALATCYCNDIYREAVKRGIKVESVDVDVEGEFAAEGAPASNVTYRAKVVGNASEAEIRSLMEKTDRVAEIQNTVRMAIPVALIHTEALPARPGRT